MADQRDLTEQLLGVARDVDRLTPFAVHMRYGAIFGPDLELGVALGGVAEMLGWAEQSI